MGNALTTPEVAELNRQIVNKREAIEAIVNDPVRKARSLNELGDLFISKYQKTGRAEDIDESIQASRDALSVADRNDPNRIGYLSNLGSSLGDRYQRFGDRSNLDEATVLAQEVVDATSLGNPRWPVYANNFAAQLFRRYSLAGSQADLDKAIRFGRKAVDLATQNQTSSDTWLYNLAIALGNRFQLSGEASDLEESIQIARRVLDATTGDHPHRARRLNNLANRLADRYARSRAMVDLEEAIQNAHEAAVITPDGHPDQATVLNTGGTLLGDMYQRTGSVDALNEALKIGQKAIDVTPKGDPNLPARLNNLGMRFRDKYALARSTGDSDNTAMNHLRESIQLLRRALAMTDPRYPDRAQWLNNLGVPLGEMYQETKAVDVLQEAVKVTQEAVAALPDVHPDRAAYLVTLGNRLADRYSRTKTTSDLSAIIASYQSALNQSNSPVLERVSAGRRVLQFHAIASDWDTAWKDAKDAVDLVPRLTDRALGNSDKQYVLGQIIGLASDATAVALNAGQVPFLALSLLEQGRSVLAAFLGDMRTDLVELQARHPDLASEFTRLRNVLDAPSTQGISAAQEGGQSLSSDLASMRSQAAHSFSTLIDNIREQSGFEDFLLPPNEEAMKAAARSGPIAVINVSELRSDVILIETSAIRCIALPDLRISELENLAQQGGRGNLAVLEELWFVVAKPVLDALGYTETPSDDDWPHIWWIPTGRLGRFPLHAAGCHVPTSTETVLDRAMSSYNSSVKAIIQGRQRRNLSAAPGKPSKALLVDMTQTPGHDPLDHVASEVKLVQSLCLASSHEVIMSTRQKTNVISQLPMCNFFHFAGHGYTDLVDPSRSSLRLEDWKKNPLTVADLMELDLHEHSPFLAYLSACGTGRVNDSKYLDESMHLISACQLAGYRHVVGTMWNAEDESCLHMAKIVYEEIFDRAMTDDSVCLGLHKATRELRDAWARSLAESGDQDVFGWRTGSDEMERIVRHLSVGVQSRSARDIKPEDGTGGKPLHWVPYIHFGV